MDTQRSSSSGLDEETASQENSGLVDRVRSSVQGTVGSATDAAGESLRGAQDSMNRVARENPIAMLLGGVAVGFLIGMTLPVSKLESERLTPIADDLKDKMKDVGAEAARRGREVMKQTMDAASSMSAAKDAATGEG